MRAIVQKAYFEGGTGFLPGDVVKIQDKMYDDDGWQYKVVGGTDTAGIALWVPKENLRILKGSKSGRRGKKHGYKKTGRIYATRPRIQNYRRDPAGYISDAIIRTPIQGMANSLRWKKKVDDLYRSGKISEKEKVKLFRQIKYGEEPSGRPTVATEKSIRRHMKKKHAYKK